MATEDERLNVRGGPGTGFDVVGKLLPGDIVRSKAPMTAVSGIRFRADDLDGETWVMAEFIARISDDSLVEEDDADPDRHRNAGQPYCHGGRHIDRED